MNSVGVIPVSSLNEVKKFVLEEKPDSVQISWSVILVLACEASSFFACVILYRVRISVNFSPITSFKLLYTNGLGSFRTVEVEDLTKHKMDSEYFEIPKETTEVVNQAIVEKRKIVAVGNSVMRALETSVSSADRLNALSGWTDKFLFPPHDFKIANVLISNFHPPESTLLMATAAFAGFEILEEAYNEAIKKKYRFLAYGDAMIII
jgi:S-adenosylmethionine:tRNA ribosyltransferase-isomerase